MDDSMRSAGATATTDDIETTLLSHDDVFDAVVVGVPHEAKGQGCYAYVVLADDARYDDALKDELVAHVREALGPEAAPDVVQWAPDGLPKSRSGKVLRRILRSIAADGSHDVASETNLVDPGVAVRLAEAARRLR